MLGHQDAIRQQAGINRSTVHILFLIWVSYINVRPAFFYTIAFVHKSVAICLIITKLLHPTI